MELSWIHFLLVCPLVFAAGFVDAIAGGGGFISLPAYIMTGIPIHSAIATNKMSSSMGTALATWKFYRKGFIPVRLALLCIAFSLVGGQIGARIAVMVSEDAFRMLMLFLVPVTALYLLKSRRFESTKEPLSARMTALLCIPISLALGIYDGFYGPGTGTFLLILLTNIVRLNVKEANGITKSINLTTNLSSLAYYLASGKVILLLGIVAGIFNVAGNYFGATYFTKQAPKRIKYVVVFVLVIFFIQQLWKQFAAN